ncbi:MAG TPA: DNA polymerase III subunit beta, partial [Streptosporangiaceae bacterium]
MRFTVSRDALGEAVAFVARALPSRPVVPVLSGILLEASDGRLTLSCFDYEVSARITVDAEVSQGGSALVPGRLLTEITRSLPARPAEFARDADMVTLSCGQAEFGLVCLPADEYPSLPASPPPVGSADGGVLAAAVAQVASSASRDDTLPMLTAICLDISGETLTLAATDRYRLAARAVD